MHFFERRQDARSAKLAKVGFLAHAATRAAALAPTYASSIPKRTSSSREL
jgi:hypothetical protein